MLLVCSRHTITAVRLVRTEPPTGGTDVCVDTPLWLEFDREPTIGTGSIELWRDDRVLVDRIDLSDPRTGTKNIGHAVTDTGRSHAFCYEPIQLDRRVARIEPHVSLEYGREYQVLIGPRVFPGFPGVRLGFRTRRREPDPETGRFVVSDTGDADFRTVQGAIDAVPRGNQRRMLIDVLPGTYSELVYVRADKPRITVRGRDREHTVIRYANNEVRNGRPTDPEARCPGRRLDRADRYNCWRANFGVEAPDFGLERITLRNETPPGSGQAEAFRGNAERIRLDQVTLTSYQDTLRLQGTGYVTASLVEGDVDFVWGVGAVFVERSELRWLRPGPLAQLRNQPGQRGAVFRDCRLTRSASVPDQSCLLGRVDAAVFPGSEVVFLDTAMDRHIAPIGWEIRHPERFSGLFADYRTSPLDHRGAVPTGTRHPLSDSETGVGTHADDRGDTIDRWGDPRFVLEGWDPR